MNILIVDDCRINRFIAESVLKKLNAELNIDKAISGFDAIVMCTNKKYDLIFMDILMENIDGINATREIRRNTKNKETMIIGYTSLDDNSSIFKDALNCNSFDFFTHKPLTLKRAKELICDPFFRKKI